jgi:hypothetical protein
VYTFKHTPRINGAPVFMNKVLFLIKLTLRCSAGDLLLEVNGLLPLRTNWLIVGIFIADHSLIGTLIFP